MIHRVRIRRLAGLDALYRPARIVVELAALDLAEVKVVDRADATEQFALGARKCSDREVTDVVECVGLQVGETHHSAGRRGLMGHDHDCW